MTGAVLADLIAGTEEDRFVLIGHSLGARVVVKAAHVLGTRNDPSKIAAIHPLGAAVGTMGEWRTLNAAVIDNVWNDHCRNDKVLANIYKVAQLGQSAVGYVGLKSSFPKIADKDVSGLVRSHGGYFAALKLVR